MDRDTAKRRADNGEQFKRGYETALNDAQRALEATFKALESQGRVFSHASAQRALAALLKGLGEADG